MKNYQGQFFFWIHFLHLFYSLLLEYLKKLRDAAQSNMSMRTDEQQKYRVVVGMATCGIAAGARPVLNTLVETVAQEKLPATVLQTGCIGMCTLEPIVEVFDRDDNKTTYVLVKGLVKPWKTTPDLYTIIAANNWTINLGIIANSLPILL